MNSRMINTKRSSGRTKSPIFLTLFNSTVSFTLFNYSKLCALISMLTSPTNVTVLKQWVQILDTLLHSNLTKLMMYSLSTLTIHRCSSCHTTYVITITTWVSGTVASCTIPVPMLSHIILAS
jgi:hypothetical protein